MYSRKRERGETSELANFFCEGPDGSDFKLSGPYSLCCNYSTFLCYSTKAINNT